MVPRHDSRRVSLGHALDKEIYQIVRRLLDTQDQYTGAHQVRLSVTSVYENIKRSNSSLSRKNRQLLEGSIERVLGVLEQEVSGSESVDGEFNDALAGGVQKVGVCWLCTLSQC